jgi:hypothetical protein
VEAYLSKTFSLRITFNPPNPAATFGVNADKYMKAAQTVLRTSIFKFLELQIKYGRRKTGRMVSGFTGMMDTYGYPYMRSWQHSDEESAQAVTEGKNLSSFFDQDPWNISIINGVEYAEYVENKVGMSELGQLPVLVPYFEKFIGENMDQLSANAAKGFDSGNFGEINDFGAPGT